MGLLLIIGIGKGKIDETKEGKGERNERGKEGWGNLFYQ